MSKNQLIFENKEKKDDLLDNKKIVEKGKVLSNTEEKKNIIEKKFSDSKIEDKKIIEKKIIESKISFIEKYKGKKIHYDKYLELEFYVNGVNLSKDITFYEILNQFKIHSGNFYVIFF